jgi:iron(III) transport system permease protein
MRAPSAGLLILTLAAVAVAVLCVLPLAPLLEKGFLAGWSGWADYLSRPGLAALAGRSLGLAAAVGVTAAIIALPLAWLTVRGRLPAQGVWVALLAAPLALPSFLVAQSAIAAFGPSGLLPGLPAGGLPVHGFLGAWLVLSIIALPYVFLPVRAAMERMPPALEDAARGLGASPWRTWREVVFPQVRPSLVAGSILAALYALSDFGAVSLLRYPTFTEVIYSHVRSSFDRTTASMHAILLVALAGLLVLAEARARGAARLRTTRLARVHVGREPLRGGARVAGLLAVLGVAGVAVGAPVAVLLSWSLRGGWTEETLRATASLALTSTGVATVAAVVAALAALPVAVLAVRRPGRLSRLLERATRIGYVLPGIVVALSLVSLSVRFAPGIYQTSTLLVLAYLVLFLPQAVGAADSSLRQADPSLEEAARGLGRGPVAAFVAATLPLALPGILSGALLVFLTTLRELPATLLLGPAGFATLSTRTWTLTEEAFFARASVHALALLAVSALCLAAATRLRAGARVETNP